MSALLLLASFAWADDPAPDVPVAPPAPAPDTAGEAPLALPVPPVEAPAAPVVAPSAASATALFPIRAANLGASEVRASEILFRRRYETAIGGATLSEDTVRAAVVSSDDAGLAAACTALGCARWITIDLVRLDKEIYVTLVERDAAGVVTQRIETVAASLDGLGVTFDRSARALAARLPIEKVPATAAAPTTTTTPTTTTAPTTTEPTTTAAPTTSRRRRVENIIGFKIGVHGPLWPDFQAALSHAFSWRREGKENFFEFDLGFTAPLGLTDARTWGMLYGEVGLSHVFVLPGGMGFYAGGGLGPRIGGYDDVGAGVGLYGQAGMMFGRNASSRVYVQAKIGGDAFMSLYSDPYVVSYLGLEAGVGF